MLKANQSIAVRVDGNLPPVAGAARAVKTNGVDSYLSLGSWEMTDDWSMSLWLQPHTVADDVYMISQHLSRGSNMFLLGYFSNSYWVRIGCFRGCDSTATVDLAFPVETGSGNQVLSTGLTGDEVRLRMREPHHVAVTFRCLSRGGNGTRPVGHLKVYQNGKLIGNKPDTAACMTRPLVPEAYRDDDWRMRPTPWEMGQEYDGGPLGGHLPGVAVVPSGFMHATFDEFVVWNASLSDAEILAVSQGGLPRPDEINVRYSFDQDDAAECTERKLWDATATCLGVNEASGRTQPSKAFPWTNSAIGHVPHVPSPFGLVPGAWIHKALPAGSCVNATLLGSDADADPLTFLLVERPKGAVLRLLGNKLELCDQNETSTIAREVTLTFDVCDPYSLCASSVTGLGRVVFHILPVGPVVVAFQALRDESALRLVFNVATNCAFVGTLEALGRVLRLSDNAAALLGARWETGCRALRLVLTDPASWFSARPAEVRAQLLDGGSVRDALGSTYPSRGTSPLLTDLSCAAGELLLPGEVRCLPCPDGSVPMLSGSSLLRECVPCSAGSAGIAVCNTCPHGRFASKSGLAKCDLCPVGSFCSEQGSTSATPCPAGSFGVASGQTACTLCTIATFQPAAGKSECVACEGVLVGSTTPFLGVSAAAGCVCPDGSYLPKRGTACLDCPVGMSCKLGSDMRNLDALSGPFPMLLPRFWSSASNPLSVFQCNDARRCPGGSPGTCSPYGRAQSCAFCEDGYHWDGERCSQCVTGAASSFVYPALPLILIPIILVGLYATSMGTDVSKWNGMENRFVTGGFILLNFFQSVDVVGSLRVPIPSKMTEMYEDFTFFNTFIDVFKPSCAGYSGLATSMLTKTLTPLGLGLVCVMLYFLSRFLSYACSRPRISMEPNCLFNIYGSIIYTFFGAISAMSIELFKCSLNPNGFKTMISDQSVTCYDSDEWKGMLVVAILSTLVYVVGMVMGLVFVMHLAKTQYLQDGFRQRWMFVFVKYQHGAYWWGLVYLSRNFLVNLSLAVFPIAMYQGTAVMIVSLLYLTLVVMIWPYRSDVCNRAEVLCTFCNVIHASIVSAFAMASDRTTYTSSADLAGVVTYLPIAVCVGILSYLLYTKFHTMFKKFSGRYFIGGRWLLEKEEQDIVHLAASLKETFTTVASITAEDFQDLLKFVSAFEIRCLMDVDKILRSEFGRNGDLQNKSVQSRRLSSQTLSGRARPSEDIVYAYVMDI